MNAPRENWNSLQISRGIRLERAAAAGLGRIVPAAKTKDLLEAVIQPGDRVCIEGNNQKQADFLSEILASVDSSKVNNLHIVQSVLALPSHIDVFERGIASKLDFSFSGPQAGRLAKLVQEERIEIGAIHTLSLIHI